MDNYDVPLVKALEQSYMADGDSFAVNATDVELAVDGGNLAKKDAGENQQLSVLVRAAGTYEHGGKPTSLRGLARLLASMTNVSARDVEPLNLVGKGSYSVVYRSYLKHPSSGTRRTVAIKRPRAKTANNLDNMTFFCEEGVLMKMLDHRAIVKAYGFGGEASLIPAEQLSQAFIVEEYLSGGTLLELLESTAAHKAVSYTLADAFRWMVDAADAIHYLHSMQPGMVIHRDIKPDNMLLDHQTPGQAKVKLTDFGLHRVIARKTGMPSSILERDILAADTNRGAICANATGESYKLTGGTGSVMYMAPEVMQKVCYNEKVDVFAFAVVMYEMFSGILLRNLYISDKDKSCAYRRYATRVNSGWRPPMPVEWPDGLRDLIADCWSQQPECRPPMQEVLQRLQALQKTLLTSRGNWSSRLKNSSSGHTSNGIPNFFLSAMERFCCLR